MKKLCNKLARKENRGIAILFSLIMLVTFFLIGFGFTSYTSSANVAAKARAPQAVSLFNTNETILNEAMAGLRNYLAPEGIGADMHLDSKLKPLLFTDGTNSFTYRVWGTKGGGGNTDLDEAFSLGFKDSNDFKPDSLSTEWSNFSWVNNVDLDGNGTNDKYAWLIIESNALDANYLGDGSTPQKGELMKELNSANLDASFPSEILVDFGSTDPFDSKKFLINAISDSTKHAIAIPNLNIQTSPITLKDRSTSGIKDITTEFTTITKVCDALWPNDSGSFSPQQKQIAANILDYIDADSESEDGGNEAVPYINELVAEITNSTDDGIPGTPETTQLSINLKGELCGLYKDMTPTTGTTKLKITGTLKYTRAPSAEKEVSIDEEIDIAYTAATGYFEGSMATPLTHTGDSLETSGTLTGVKLTISSMILEGSSVKWDEVTEEINSEIASMAKGSFDCALEAKDPRWNHESWDATDIEPAATNTLGAKNSGYQQTDGESGEPEDASTAYIRNSAITSFIELGYISRNIGETLNLVDYDTTANKSFSNYKPGALVLKTESSFNGGDRQILDDIRVGSGNGSYDIFGPINPNTDKSDVLKVLLQSALPQVGTDKAKTAVDSTTLDNITSNFPFTGGTTAAADDTFFKVEHFHDAATAPYDHNRNPKTYGYPFSTMHPDHSTQGTNIPNDAQREAMTLLMQLVSPKYSYFTVLVATEINGNITTGKYFIQRYTDIPSGDLTLKIIK